MAMRGSVSVLSGYKMGIADVQMYEELLILVKVGSAGEKGTVEWSDMMVGIQGPSAGVVLIEWNLDSSGGEPSGMWDVDTRIGLSIRHSHLVSSIHSTALSAKRKIQHDSCRPGVPICGAGLYSFFDD